MKWKKFTLTTTTEAVDLVSSMFDDIGIEGIEIEDNVPLTDKETKGMFIDILPELPPDEDVYKRQLLFQQFIVVPTLNDFPFFQYHNGLGVAHRGQTVGNDEHGAAVHQGVHSFFDEFFRPCVNGAGSLIQDQHRRPGDGCPCNGQKLPLALGQVGTVTVKHCVIPVSYTHLAGGSDGAHPG